MDGVRLRAARPGEEEVLSALCLRSKAHWGYDANFLAACAPYLRITSEAIAAGHATVAVDAEDRPLGVVQIAPGSKLGSLDLLFIEPKFIGHGLGRLLFDHARTQLIEEGEAVMTILSDPDAEAAYVHMGARRVRMRPSDVFKGRELPWLELPLHS